MSDRTRVARNLRRHTTDAERLLWNALRGAFPGRRIRRQHPIGRYVVDFACPAHKLAIEIDGGHHAVEEQADRTRTEAIARHGYRVVRFWNNQVLQNLPGVLQEIAQHLAGDGSAELPSPPFRGEREGPAQQEGEVGVGNRSGIPHLTPTLSAPRGAEGEQERR